MVALGRVLSLTRFKLGFGWGLIRVRGGWIGGVNLRFRQAFGWQMAVKQVGVQRLGWGLAAGVLEIALWGNFPIED